MGCVGSSPFDMNFRLRSTTDIAEPTMHAHLAAGKTHAVVVDFAQSTERGPSPVQQHLFLQQMIDELSRLIVGERLIKRVVKSLRTN